MNLLYDSETSRPVSGKKGAYFSSCERGSGKGERHSGTFLNVSRAFVGLAF
jgi:hypothetical protein